ncbi:MAG TPA: hypothetical protein VGE07_12550 [Herpetosiphonaceae bacterium]
MKRIALIIFMLALIAPLGQRRLADAAAPAQPPGPSQLRLLDHLGGLPRQVVVRGGYAYVGANYDLEIIDVRDPANPAPVGSVLLERPISGLAVVNGYAYALSTGRLTIISVANPQAPAVVGMCAACGGYDITLDGTLATVLAAGGYHFFVDLAEPRAPRVVGGILADHTFGSVALSGNRAYHAVPWGGCIPDTICFEPKLKIVDISDLDNPRYVGEAPIAGTPSTTPLAVAGGYAAVGHSGRLEIFLVAGRETPLSLGAAGAGGSIVDVASDGQRAVAVGETETGGFLAVFQINPAAPPIRIGYVALPGKPSQLRAGGGWAYVAAGAAGLRIVSLNPDTAPVERANVFANSFQDLSGIAADPASGRLVATGSANLRSIDAANPRKLRVLGASASPLPGTQVELIGSTAFVQTEIDGVHLLDVSQPAQPRFLARTWLQTQPMPTVLVRIAASRTPGGLARLYAAAGPDLLRADVTNPAQPALLPAIPSLQFATRIRVDGLRAYVQTTNGPLWMLDVSDPANIKPLGYLPLNGFYSPVAADGRVYMIGEVCPPAQPCVKALRIVDVSDPRAPVEVATHTGADYGGNELLLDGSLLYLIASGELRVFDVADPLAVRLVGRYQAAEPGFLYNIQRNGDHLYVRGSGVVEIIDISQPLTPTFAGSLRLSSIGGMAVSGRYLHLVDGTHRLQTFDITDPANPTLAGIYNPASDPNSVDRVQAVGNIVTVGLGDGDSIGIIETLNMANPAAPQLLGSRATSYVQGIYQTDSRLYVARWGLQILDLNSPANLPLIGEFYPGDPNGITLSGNYAFVNHEHGLRALDVSDPQRAVELDFMEHANPPVSANPAPTRMVHLGGSALIVIDASDPSRLSRLSVTPFPAGTGSCANFVTRAAYLYAACNSGRVLVYDMTDPRQPALAASTQMIGALRSIALLDDGLAVAGEAGLFTLSHLVVNHQTFLPGVQR